MPQFLYRIQPTRLGMLTQGPTDSEAAVVAQHFAYLQHAQSEGTVLMAGRTLTMDDTAFGIVIFIAESEARAAEFARNDPAVQQGVMRAQVFPFRIALWSAQGPPTE